MRTIIFKITTIIACAFILYHYITMAVIFFPQVSGLSDLACFDFNPPEFEPNPLDIAVVASEFLYIVSMLFFTAVVLLKLVGEKLRKLEYIMEFIMPVYLFVSAFCIIFEIIRIIRRTIIFPDALSSPLLNSLELLGLFLLFASFVGVMNCHAPMRLRYRKFTDGIILTYAIAVILIFTISIGFLGFSYIIGNAGNTFDASAIIDIISYICLTTMIGYIFMHPDMEYLCKKLDVEE